MPVVSMKELLESGVHLGHQTRRWNPKMKPYIFAERGGIHIIDLQQTTVLLDRAYEFVRNIASRGGTILLVGTKKQCRDVIREEAERIGMPHVSHRWLGGLLTNFVTIEKRIRRMHELRRLKEEGQIGLLPTKERMAMERELEKLEINLGGVANMTRLPDAVFVADPKREAIATKEVNKLGIPLIALCDTNCDPDEVDYVIPGNDDAIKSCSLIIRTLARAVEEGRAKMQISEFLAEGAEEAKRTEDSIRRSYELGDEGVEEVPAHLGRGYSPAAGAREARAHGGGRQGSGGRGSSSGRSGGERSVLGGRQIPRTSGTRSSARSAGSGEGVSLAEGVGHAAAPESVAEPAKTQEVQQSMQQDVVTSADAEAGSEQ